MAAINPTKVIIPCRISYAHLFEPTSQIGGIRSAGSNAL